jgi:hypothetical protein
MFTTVKRVQPPAKLLIEFRRLRAFDLITLFWKPQRFPDDFARRAIGSGFRLSSNELP